MKKITMKEAKLNDFPNETPGKIATQIKDYIDGPNANPTLKKYSDEITLQSNPDGFLRFGYWERLPEDAFEALELQYDIEMDSDEDDDTGTLYFYNLTPKHNRPTQSGVAKFLTKEDLMEMIREELAEALGIGGTDSVNFQQDDTANESKLDETKLFADFSLDSDDSIESRFARSISEIAREYEHMDNIEIPNFFDEYEDGDDVYAGPIESLRFFQTLPNEFVVTNNMNNVDESFKITKTGDDSFTAEEI
jgi:hypothetical protein